MPKGTPAVMLIFFLLAVVLVWAAPSHPQKVESTEAINWIVIGGQEYRPADLRAAFESQGVPYLRPDVYENVDSLVFSGTLGITQEQQLRTWFGQNVDFRYRWRMPNGVVQETTGNWPKDSVLLEVWLVQKGGH